MLRDIREILYLFRKSIKQYYFLKKHPKTTYQEYKRQKTYEKFEDPRRVSIYSSVSLSLRQIEEIDNLYLHNYGQKIPYTWHKHFTAFTGKFDKNYIPETLYIPEFEYYMNLNREYAGVLEDKNFCPLVAVGAGLKVPDTIISCTEGLYRYNNAPINKEAISDVVSNIGEVFIKPSIGTSSGNGCILANFKSGVDLLSSKPIDAILDEIGSNFCMQKVIVCSDAIRRIYPHSVNTFRVITYRWGDDIRLMPIIMRIGQGKSFVDNAHAGGMFIAIDNDGHLHDTAFTEFKAEYKQHPDTQITFNRYRIPNFEKVIENAKRLHSYLPQIGVVNWDFTIDNTETPVLIEANVNGGSIWMAQMAHGCGVFGELTEEVLQWLKLMNSLPESEYYKYMFGQIH